MPITTNVVSSNPLIGEAYLIQHYVIKFVSDLRQVGVFLRGKYCTSTLQWVTNILGSSHSTSPVLSTRNWRYWSFKMETASSLKKMRYNIYWIAWHSKAELYIGITLIFSICNRRITHNSTAYSSSNRGYVVSHVINNSTVYSTTNRGNVVSHILWLIQCLQWVR
jgi:hypothetical protein